MTQEDRLRGLPIVRIVSSVIGLLVIAVLGVGFWQWSLRRVYETRLLALESSGVETAYFNATDEEFVIELGQVPFERIEKDLDVPGQLHRALVSHVDLRGIDAEKLRKIEQSYPNVSQLKVDGTLKGQFELEAMLKAFPNAVFIELADIEWDEDMVDVLEQHDVPLNIIATASRKSGEEFPDKIGEHVFIQWFYRDNN